jgi:hypothetical protein
MKRAAAKPQPPMTRQEFLESFSALCSAFMVDTDREWLESRHGIFGAPNKLAQQHWRVSTAR